MTELQKLPPCDACGTESCDSPLGFEFFRGSRLCATCWRKPSGEVDAAIAARRAKQEPEFYGTCPAGTPEDPLPKTLPDGVRWYPTGSKDPCVLSGSIALRALHSLSIYVAKKWWVESTGRVCGDDGGGFPAHQLDWSRIPRQPPPPEAPAVATVRCDGMVGSRRCELPCGHVQPVHMVTTEPSPAPDPYAAIRENEHAATVNTLAHDLERRRTGKIAALRLDLDRPSGKVKYPESWPEKFSGASYEDD